MQHMKEGDGSWGEEWGKGQNPESVVMWELEEEEGEEGRGGWLRFPGHHMFAEFLFVCFFIFSKNKIFCSIVFLSTILRVLQLLT